MANQISIKLREVYGETKAYPVCPKAQTFAAMLGTKTLTQSALRSIRELGFEVIVVDSNFGTFVGKLAA